eukprot:g196.t1
MSASLSSATVAPDVNAMTRGEQPDLRAQPALPGNGCCCNCCGAAPGKVDPSRIVRDGGKWLQLEDGRIVEYFVYGSDKPDARILVQVNGSMGTGWVFSHIAPVQNKLVELNVKGISVSVPGFGYSSPNVGRRMGAWASTDLEPVLEAEGVSGEFMIEGSSYGTSHVMGALHYFKDRITAGHLHVPYLPLEMRREKGWKLYGEDDGMKCSVAWTKSCRSGYAFCCCSCMVCCTNNCPGCFDDADTKKAEQILPGYTKILHRDLQRSAYFGAYGWIHNAIVPTTGENWGFDPRDIRTKKIIVSWAKKDVNAPAEHGKFLASHFDGLPDVEVIVNVGEEGHSSFTKEMLTGKFVEQLCTF